MFKYIEGNFISEYTNREDFTSDLAKSLYGTRSAAFDAAWAYDAFIENHPGQIPVIFESMLCTGSEVEAFLAEREREIERVRQAKIAAKRAEREAWNNASPMREALRKAGLA